MKIKSALAMLLAAVAPASLASSIADADERPSMVVKPLVEIITMLEAEGYSPITEISMENGIWEVEAYKDNVERELRVNPLTGQILSERNES